MNVGISLKIVVNLIFILYQVEADPCGFSNGPINLSYRLAPTPCAPLPAPASLGTSGINTALFNQLSSLLSSGSVLNSASTPNINPTYQPLPIPYITTAPAQLPTACGPSAGSLPAPRPISVPSTPCSTPVSLPTPGLSTTTNPAILNQLLSLLTSGPSLSSSSFPYPTSAPLLPTTASAPLSTSTLLPTSCGPSNISPPLQGQLPPLVSSRTSSYSVPTPCSNPGSLPAPRPISVPSTPCSTPVSFPTPGLSTTTNPAILNQLLSLLTSGPSLSSSSSSPYPTSAPLLPTTASAPLSTSTLLPTSCGSSNISPPLQSQLPPLVSSRTSSYSVPTPCSNPGSLPAPRPTSCSTPSTVSLPTTSSVVTPTTFSSTQVSLTAPTQSSSTAFLNQLLSLLSSESSSNFTPTPLLNPTSFSTPLTVPLSTSSPLSGPLSPTTSCTDPVSLPTPFGTSALNPTLLDRQTVVLPPRSTPCSLPASLLPSTPCSTRGQSPCPTTSQTQFLLPRGTSCINPILERQLSSLFSSQ